MRRIIVALVLILVLVALCAGSCELSNNSYSTQPQAGTWQGCYGNDPNNPYTCVSGSGIPGQCPDYFNDLMGNNYPLIRKTCH